MSNSLWHHGLQHAELPCPSLSLGVCSNSCLLCQRCYPTISSSVSSFSSYLQSFSAVGSFPMNQLFTSGGQSIGVSASASVLPMNIQDWFPLGFMIWSPCSPRDSQESSPTPQFEIIILWHSAFSRAQHSHLYMTTGETIALTVQTFVSKWCLCFSAGSLGLS